MMYVPDFCSDLEKHGVEILTLEIQIRVEKAFPGTYHNDTLEILEEKLDTLKSRYELGRAYCREEVQTWLEAHMQLIKAELAQSSINGMLAKDPAAFDDLQDTLYQVAVDLDHARIDFSDAMKALELIRA